LETDIFYSGFIGVLYKLFEDAVQSVLYMFKLELPACDTSGVRPLFNAWWYSLGYRFYSGTQIYK
jgi:hypothetical protein